MLFALLFLQHAAIVRGVPVVQPFSVAVACAAGCIAHAVGRRAAVAISNIALPVATALHQEQLKRHVVALADCRQRAIVSSMTRMHDGQACLARSSSRHCCQSHPGDLNSCRCRTHTYPGSSGCRHSLPHSPSTGYWACSNCLHRYNHRSLIIIY